MQEGENYLAQGRKFNLKQNYGELGEGEYDFTTIVNGPIRRYIRITFNITQDGKLSYSEPTIE